MGEVLEEVGVGTGGIDLDRSTLAGWIGHSCALLKPLADTVGRHVLAGRAIDEAR